jgi:elongation factor P--beta-lysine ligase
MLEWYEVGAPYTHIMDQCGEMLRVAARESGTTSWRRGKRTIDPFAAPERLTVAEALARRTPHDPRVAERFELYACGVELANCFGELTDPIEQRRRFEAEMDEKERIYGVRYPIDEDFLDALAQMPPTSGGALGFDRLVMLATGADRIDQVLWTPVA